MEQRIGKTSQDLEEMMGIKFGSLHEALEVEGQESREETTRRLVEMDVGHNQAPPKGRLEILVHLLLRNANYSIEGGVDDNLKNSMNLQPVLMNQIEGEGVIPYP